MLWSFKKDGPFLLAIALPIIAVLTALRIIHCWSSRSSTEVNYLLPFNNETLSRQIRAEILNTILLGAIPAMLAGAFGSHRLGLLAGSLQGLLIYLGLLGFLSFSYVWKFFAIFAFLSKAAFVLLFSSRLSDAIEEFSVAVIVASPWFLALNSPLILILQLLIRSFVSDRRSDLLRQS